MNALHSTTHDAGGSTFYPPIDVDTDVIGPSWEAQLAALAAWQDAIARDYEARNAHIGPNPFRDRRESGADRSAMDEVAPHPTMQTITRLTTLLVSLQEQLRQIQTDAANVAISEMTVRHGAADDDDALPLPALHGDNVLRCGKLFQQSTTTLRGALAALGEITGLNASSDRRQCDLVIGFPDRRAA